MPERATVFIDGSNLFHALRRRDPNYRGDILELARLLCKDYQLQRIYYYCARPIQKTDSPEDREKVSKQLKFQEALSYLPGVMVKTFRLKEIRETCEECKHITTGYIEKGLDVNLAVDMLHLAHQKAFDVAVLISGDGDYVEAVKVLDTLGKKVVNAFVRNGRSNELAKASWSYIPLEPLLEQAKKK